MAAPHAGKSPSEPVPARFLEPAPRFYVYDLCEALFGPLVGPECRRALRGGSVLVARSLAVLPSCLIVLCVAWVCWVFPTLDPNFSPAGTLWGGLLAVEGLLVTAALILGPAVLAGALAGDQA